MRKLEKAKKKGEVDPEIVSLLDYLNSLEDFYTTSSCAGRITLLHDVGSKRDNEWLGKWHRPVELEEVMEALKEMPGRGVVWFKYEPSILHIVARRLDGAGKILRTARNHGFKRVGVMALKKERYMIEICSTEKVDAPLAEDGRFLVDREYIKYLIDLADKQFKEGREKLGRLEEGFREDLS
jgi:tRNA wybutosine-synthesizing protein 3